MSDASSFHTTRWSLVVAASGGDASASGALEDLCRAYWFPLYAYVRRRGVSVHEAEDVVQGFFAQLIEQRALASVAPERGRFRSFLLAAVRHHLANRRAHDRAAKRGGGRVLTGVDFGAADQRFELEALARDEPERAFERAWARELLRACLAELGDEYVSSGRAAVFETLKPELQRAGDATDYAEHAASLGLSLGAVKVAVHRLRQRFAERLRARIAATVAAPDDVELELAALRDALSAGAP